MTGVSPAGCNCTADGKAMARHSPKRRKTEMNFNFIRIMRFPVISTGGADTTGHTTGHTTGCTMDCTRDHTTSRGKDNIQDKALPKVGSP